MTEVARSFAELLHALRREGLTISTAQAIVATRAVALVGLSDRARLRAALRAALVDGARARPVFEAAFDEVFRGEHAHATELFARLRAGGFSEAELSLLRELLDAMAKSVGGVSGASALAALRGGDADLEALLRGARVAGVLSRAGSRAHVGFVASQLSESVGLTRLADPLARIEAALRETLEADRAAALGLALRAELERLKRRVRAHVDKIASRAEAESTSSTSPLERLGEGETEGVRRALRVLADKLRGAERARRRRARRGRVDLRRTLRAASATLGVPMRLVAKRKRPDRARLVVLCDVSESVRRASALLLEFVLVAQSLFARTRSFVFVSELRETTDLFDARGPDAALAEVFSGRVVRTTENSSYARALAAMLQRHGNELDRKTTLVVLGDGRTNFQGDGLEALRELRARVRALVWITPEPRSAWGAGDSAMPRYAAVATEVLVARTAAELEEAARAIVRRR